MGRTPALSPRDRAVNPRESREGALRRADEGALEAQMRRGDPSAWPLWRPEVFGPDEVLDWWRDVLARRGSADSPATLQIYVHLAFCRSNCSYCQYFHAVPRSRSQLSDYGGYLSASLIRYREALGQIAATHAYFGGGTPTVLPVELLEPFLAEFKRTFRVEGEWTCEGHPTSLDLEKIRLLGQAGVNRMSFGLQSLDAEVLKTIRRKNRALDALGELVGAAQDLGMEVNLDLVLGLPRQTPDSIRRDLLEIAVLGADSVTVYRYQPVPDLAEAAQADLRLSRVFGAKLIAELIASGYWMFSRPRDEAVGVKLWRNTSRARRWVARAALAAGARQLLREREPASYGCFQEPRSHLLGLGPSAFSHAFGRAWYREVTRLDGLSEKAVPVYLGSRLSVDDEWRTATLRELQRRRWVDAARIAQLDGAHDLVRCIDALLDAPAATAALERRGRRFRLRRNAPEAARSELVHRLLPARGLAAGEGERAAEEIRALALRPDVERRLVGLDAEAESAGRSARARADPTSRLDQLAANAPRAPRTRSAAVVTHLRCNQACLFCVARRSADDLRFISGAAVRQRIASALASGAEEIWLTGGEPTMRGDLEALIAFARERGARSVGLETTGTLLDPSRVRSLASSGLAEVRLQMSGWGPGLDVVTRDPGGFDRALGGLGRALEEGLHVEIASALTQSTADALKSLPRRLRQHFAERCPGRVWLHIPSEAPEPSEMLSYREAIPVIVQMDASAREVGICLALDPGTAPPPCVFAPSERPRALYAAGLDRWRRTGRQHVDACRGCKVSERCGGVVGSYLRRFGRPRLWPIDGTFDWSGVDEPQ
jgi:coproporphyrinogen III oxidase-like Fe-S oxidoreductase/uncharacterized Fe-S cluster-containing radical SAM superfamily protein